MEHNVDTLTTLNSIHTIPDDGHCSAVECYPHRAIDTKGSSVENWETDVVLGAGSAIEHNDDRDEHLTPGGATKRLPHAKAEGLR